MQSTNIYEMTMNLNVLRHLGLNLYSNVPAVLSEVVANAWDADADTVRITIDDECITIIDTGSGMNSADINTKFLQVGYQKRESGYTITPKYGRPVMGRKGIGKLSLFSIARKIEIHTCKDGRKYGFIIDTTELEKKIKDGDSKYFPRPLNDNKIDISHNGTKIILTDLKKRTMNTATFLRKRLARRFSVIGSEHKFDIIVNDSPISVSDRDYFHKIEYLWTYSSNQDAHFQNCYAQYCNQNKLKEQFLRSPVVDPNLQYQVHGWIGTVENSGDLKDENENINKIVIMVRGKLAQEDILEDFSEGGLYSKYLIGELHADFLDLDDEEDIATSSRQKIIEDDPRYILLKEFVYVELKNIQTTWTKLRNEKGKHEALKLQSIKNWFEELGSDHKRKAESLFGKINQLTLDDTAKKDLFKHGVLAFESFRYKENLDAFDRISPENIEEFGRIFADFDDIEATLYHQIIVERLKVINLLKEKVDDRALEKVLQEHIYKHLWLLDPSWDRATEAPLLEERMTTQFPDIDDGLGLTPEEKTARFDIKYKKSSGKHVIIELKRADIVVDTFTLSKQVDKYYVTLKKILKACQIENEPIEIICIVGKPLKQWVDEEGKKQSMEVLKQYHARVVLYDQLIGDSQNMYQTFIEKNQVAGRISRLLNDIEQDTAFL